MAGFAGLASMMMPPQMPPPPHASGGGVTILRHVALKKEPKRKGATITVVREPLDVIDDAESTVTAID